jgi:hypothetical protein
VLFHQDFRNSTTRESKAPCRHRLISASGVVGAKASGVTKSISKCTLVARAHDRRRNGVRVDLVAMRFFSVTIPIARWPPDNHLSHATRAPLTFAALRRKSTKACNGARVCRRLG